MTEVIVTDAVLVNHPDPIRVTEDAARLPLATVALRILCHMAPAEAEPEAVVQASFRLAEVFVAEVARRK